VCVCAEGFHELSSGSLLSDLEAHGYTGYTPERRRDVISQVSVCVCVHGGSDISRPPE